MPQPVTFGRVLIVLAASVIVLGGIYGAASILAPILFALVFALIFSPIYAWLLRRGVPTGLAIIIMLVGQIVLFGLIGYIIAASIAQLSSRLAFYASQLDAFTTTIQNRLAQLGLTTFRLRDIMSGGHLTSLLGALLGAIGAFLGSAFVIIPTMLFFIVEGPAIMRRLREGVQANNAQVARLTTFGQGVIRQFGVRALVNLFSSGMFTVLLLLLGVDSALLWGILAFFLAYIPYLGFWLSMIPPVLLALAEFGLPTALLVIIGGSIANVVAENVLSPTLMSRGLNISPTVVFLSFMIWTWLLGAPGAFLAMPLTVLLLLMLETFPETRWLARVMVVRAEPAPADVSAADVANRPA
jgi:predicted PurR-regulated permease PerM